MRGRLLADGKRFADIDLREWHAKTNLLGIVRHVSQFLTPAVGRVFAHSGRFYGGRLGRGIGRTVIGAHFQRVGVIRGRASLLSAHFVQKVTRIRRIWS